MNQRVLITSALPYASSTKHLGNLCGSLLPADVHARFRRAIGDDVLFLCGTDDHGTPIEIAAEKGGIPVADLVAQQHAAHARLYERYDLSFDHFGSTSSPQNRELTQLLLVRLHQEGLLETRTELRHWSDVDGRFLPDRYIEGTCPHCGSTQARGDQCEACTRLLDPEDLIEPRSSLSGDKNLRRRETKHLYFRQDLLQRVLEEWLASREGGWSRIAIAIARTWLAEGIEPRCISRDLDWGIPIPLDGFEGKVAYVWFDAPIGYAAIGIEWEAADPANRDFFAWWGREAEGEYVQFVGKDSVPFHAVTFPATILGSRADLRTVDRLKSYHWLTFEGSKFSTSRGRGLFLDDALELLPSDVWRWWLTAHAPETDDSNFSFELLASTVNSDLVGLLGNLVNRVLHHGEKRFAGTAPTPRPLPDALHDAVRSQLIQIAAAHRDLESRQAAAATRALWSIANRHVVHEAPWEAGISNDKAESRFAIALALLAICAKASAPILPRTAAIILTALSLPLDSDWPNADVEILAGTHVVRPDLLFARISDRQVEAWQGAHVGE